MRRADEVHMAALHEVHAPAEVGVSERTPDYRIDFVQAYAMQLHGTVVHQKPLPVHPNLANPHALLAALDGRAVGGGKLDDEIVENGRFGSPQRRLFETCAEDRFAALRLGREIGDMPPFAVCDERVEAGSFREFSKRPQRHAKFDVGVVRRVDPAAERDVFDVGVAQREDVHVALDAAEAPVVALVEAGKGIVGDDRHVKNVLSRLEKFRDVELVEVVGAVGFADRASVERQGIAVHHAVEADEHVPPLPRGVVREHAAVLARHGGDVGGIARAREPLRLPASGDGAFAPIRLADEAEIPRSVERFQHHPVAHRINLALGPEGEGRKQGNACRKKSFQPLRHLTISHARTPLPSGPFVSAVNERRPLSNAHGTSPTLRPEMSSAWTWHFFAPSSSMETGSRRRSTSGRPDSPFRRTISLSGPEYATPSRCTSTSARKSSREDLATGFASTDVRNTVPCLSPKSTLSRPAETLPDSANAANERGVARRNEPLAGSKRMLPGFGSAGITVDAIASASERRIASGVSTFGADAPTPMRQAASRPHGGVVPSASPPCGCTDFSSRTSANLSSDGARSPRARRAAPTRSASKFRGSELQARGAAIRIGRSAIRLGNCKGPVPDTLESGVDWPFRAEKRILVSDAGRIRPLRASRLVGVDIDKVVCLRAHEAQRGALRRVALIGNRDLESKFVLQEATRL